MSAGQVVFKVYVGVGVGRDRHQRTPDTHRKLILTTLSDVYIMFIQSGNIMNAVIQKWGNSLGVRIPGSIAKELNLENGTQVEILDDEGKIVILPAKSRDLHELLEKITDENVHGEVSTGDVVGKEEW